MRRLIISPGIVSEVGKEPAFVAASMLGRTLDDMLYDGKAVEREAYTLRDIMFKTGLPKNPAKQAIRRLMKRQIVTETLAGVYRLTWTALLHHCYIRDRVIAQSNDGLLQTAANWEHMQKIQKDIKELQEAIGDGEGTDPSDSEGRDDDTLHGRDVSEVHDSPQEQEIDGGEGTVGDSEGVAGSS